ncbi:MAG: HAD family hydrolase [Endomicrobiales bacterium]
MRDREYRLILFDLDGTLVNSQNDLAAAVNHVRSLHGKPPLALDAVRSYVGNGVRALTERALPGLLPEDITRSVEQLKNYYRDHALDTTLLYPGINDVLSLLAGKTMAVLTNKPEEFSRKILEGLDIARCFAVIWGGDTGARKKPDPEPVRAIMRQLNVPAEETILVGDGPNDILAAKAAGISSLAVGYGYTGKEELLALSPDYFVSSPLDIVSCLTGAAGSLKE